MRRLLVTLALAGAAAGCATSDYQRVEFDDLGLAVQPMDGWSLERQPGALVYVADAEVYGERVTVAIQSSRKLSPDVPDQAAPEAIISATQTLLRAMPDAEVSQPTLTERTGMRAAYFDLSFRPRNRSERYERRHVVLIGEQRVFHVLHTAPAGALAESADVFESVVRSIRERSQS